MGVEYESTIYFMERIIRDSLTRSLGDIQNPLQDEISRGFDSVFGDNSAEWTNHNAYVSMQKIILQAMCRVFFGEEISRNPRFLHTYSRYILAMGVGTMIIGMLPGFLKRIFVPVFNLPLWYYRRQTLKHLVPVVERQMAKGGTDEQSYDFISQCAKASVKSTIDKTVAGPSLLAEWMMLLVRRPSLHCTLHTSSLYNRALQLSTHLAAKWRIFYRTYFTPTRTCISTKYFRRKPSPY